MNGTTALGNWTGLFRRGEKVRLRFINGSAMTYFDVRIPGLKMTVVAADGQYVHPVTVDEFRIAVAETFDVIVEPTGQDAFTIFAQDMGRTGYVSGTLAVREGLRAPVPALDPRPILTHGRHGPWRHGGMGTTCRDAHASQRCAAAWQPWRSMPATHGGMDHGDAACRRIRPARPGNPLVDMQTMAPTPKLDDPGIGLRDNGRTVLTYADLKSAFDDPDGREPGRDDRTAPDRAHGEVRLVVRRRSSSPSAEPLRLNYGERLRIVLVNDTMMTHPIHLHGMWSDLEDEHGNFQVRKHTIDMPPGSRRSYRVRADALGPLGVPLPPALPHGSRDDARSGGAGMNAPFAKRIAIGDGAGFATAPALAQEVDHSKMHHPPPPTGGRKVRGSKASRREGPSRLIDHAAMGHAMPAAPTEPKRAHPRGDRCRSTRCISGARTASGTWRLDQLVLADGSPGSLGCRRGHGPGLGSQRLDRHRPRPPVAAQRRRSSGWLGGGR